MLDLIKFELYKIFSKKSVRTVLLLTVIFSMYGVFGESIYFKYKGLDSVNDAYNIMKKYEGKTITQEGIDNANNIIEDIVKKEESGKSLTKEELVYNQYLFEGLVSGETIYKICDEYYTLNEIENEISRIEKGDRVNTYEHKNLKYIYNKVKNEEEAKYHFNHGWLITTDFKVIVILISLLVVVGLAPLFSDEYQSNSAQIILSCRRGKNKLVLSKILTGLIFTVIIFTIINSIFLISAWRYDFIGWDNPLELFKYYRSTPFDMRIIDFYFVGLGISFIGAILFALVTMLISLLVKNNMMSLLLSLAIYYVPKFIGDFMPMDKIARVFTEINIAEAIKVEGMFISPNTFNILGSPVLYSTVLISLVVVFIPVVICLIKYFGKRQAI